MVSPKFKAKIKKGKLYIEDRKLFDMYVEGQNDGEYVVSVSKKKKDRSLGQNRYYWGTVIKMIAEETGYSHTSDGEAKVHDYMREMFLLYKDFVLDKEITRIKSTTDLSTVEFEEYLSKIKMWASQFLNLYIPDPIEIQV